MLLYALRFVISKLSVDAFSLLYSKLLHAKLSLFVFGAYFAESLWQVISIFSCFIPDFYRVFQINCNVIKASHFITVDQFDFKFGDIM